MAYSESGKIVSHEEAPFSLDSSIYLSLGWCCGTSTSIPQHMHMHRKETLAMLIAEIFTGIYNAAEVPQHISCTCKSIIYRKETLLIAETFTGIYNGGSIYTTIHAHARVYIYRKETLLIAETFTGVYNEHSLSKKFQVS